MAKAKCFYTIFFWSCCIYQSKNFSFMLAIHCFSRNQSWKFKYQLPVFLYIIDNDFRIIISESHSIDYSSYLLLIWTILFSYLHLRLNFMKIFFNKIFFQLQFLNVQYQNSFDANFLLNGFSCFKLLKKYFSNYFSGQLTEIFFLKSPIHFLWFWCFNHFSIWFNYWSLDSYSNIINSEYLSVQYCLSYLLLESINHT